jgi:hypothetical protein
MALKRARFAVWMVCAALAAGSAACATRAEDLVAGPPLLVPEPPERVLAPVEEPPLETASSETEPAPAPEAPPRTTARPAPAARPQPSPPAAVEAPPEPAPVAMRELRANPSVDTAEAARAVRDTLTRAARDIERVDYARLSAAGRTQYDQSKRFSEQSDQALRERNYVFAATLADKAATLAAELARR